MKSIDFLEKVKTQHKLKNDRQLALFLGKGTNTISQYMSGSRVMDEETCLAVALALEIEPATVLMAAGIERASRTGQKSLWETYARRTGVALGVSALSFVTLFVTPGNTEARQLKGENAPAHASLSLM